jgi:hypothetical protein
MMVSNLAPTASSAPDFSLPSAPRLRPSLNMRSEEIDAIFSALDENGDGVVTMEELLHVLERSQVGGGGAASGGEAWILGVLNDIVGRCVCRISGAAGAPFSIRPRGDSF